MLSVLRSIFPSQHLWNYLNYGRSNFVRKFTQKNAIKWWFPAWFVSRVTWESQNTRVYITCNHECFMLFLRWTCNTFLLSLFVSNYFLPLAMFFLYLIFFVSLKKKIFPTFLIKNTNIFWKFPSSLCCCWCCSVNCVWLFVTPWTASC